MASSGCAQLPFQILIQPLTLLLAASTVRGIAIPFLLGFSATSPSAANDELDNSELKSPAGYDGGLDTVSSQFDPPSVISKHNSDAYASQPLEANVCKVGAGIPNILAPDLGLTLSLSPVSNPKDI